MYSLCSSHHIEKRSQERAARTTTIMARVIRLFVKLATHHVGQHVTPVKCLVLSVPLILTQFTVAQYGPDHGTNDRLSPIIEPGPAMPATRRVVEDLSGQTIPAARSESGNRNVRLTLQKVLEVGDQAPGLEEGVTIATIGSEFQGPLEAMPTIDAAGNIGFGVTLAGFAVCNRANFPPQALYRTIDGEVELVFDECDPAPGTNGNFNRFPLFISKTPFIHEGTLVFLATTDNAVPPHTPPVGIWSDRFGETELVLYDDDTPADDVLPGLPAGHQIFQFGFGAFKSNILANIRYNISSPVPNENEGIWRNRDGPWELLIINGMQAPGLPEGVVFGIDPLEAFGPIFSWTFNRNTELMAYVWLNGPGIDFTNDETIYLETAPGLELLVREGDTAPGFGQGMTFGPNVAFPVFGGTGDNIFPTLNDSGSAVFGSFVDGPLGLHNSIWTKRNGELELIVKGAVDDIGGFGEGDQAPGFPPGRTFQRFIFGRINESNQIAFAGFLNTDEPLGSQEGFWWERDGVLELLVAEDLPVPGIPGAVFSDLGFPGLRDDGSLVFAAEFEGPGIDFSNDFAVFRANPDGSTDIILRTGDFVEIVDDEGNRDVRQVSPVFGIGAGISDTGERVFEVFFVDGSTGIYTANALPGKRPGPGDLDADGTVGVSDLLILLASWGPCIDCDDCIADLDDNCTVGVSDLLILLSNWG